MTWFERNLDVWLPLMDPHCRSMRLLDAIDGDLWSFNPAEHRCSTHKKSLGFRTGPFVDMFVLYVFLVGPFWGPLGVASQIQP